MRRNAVILLFGLFAAMLVLGFLGSCDVVEYRAQWKDFVASVRVGEPLRIPRGFEAFVKIIEENPEYVKYHINTDANHNDMWVCVKDGKIVSVWARKHSAGSYNSY